MPPSGSPRPGLLPLRSASPQGRGPGPGFVRSRRGGAAGTSGCCHTTPDGTDGRGVRAFWAGEGATSQFAPPRYLFPLPRHRRPTSAPRPGRTARFRPARVIVYHFDSPTTLLKVKQLLCICHLVSAPCPRKGAESGCSVRHRPPPSPVPFLWKPKTENFPAPSRAPILEHDLHHAAAGYERVRNTGDGDDDD